MASNQGMDIDTCIEQAEQAQWDFLYKNVGQPPVAAAVVKHLLDHEIDSRHRGLFLRAMVTIEKERRRAARVAAVLDAFRAVRDTLRFSPGRASKKVRAQQLLSDPDLVMELAQTLKDSGAILRGSAEAGLGNAAQES